MVGNLRASITLLLWFRRLAFVADAARPGSSTFALGRAVLREWRLISVAVFAATVLFASGFAWADIVIDDFVDGLRIDLPEQNTERVVSQSIGDFSALRSVAVNGLRPIPNGFLDIDQTQPSALTVEIPTSTQIPPDGILNVSLVYSLATLPSNGVDLGEGGKNNAVILEFDRLTADSPLSHSRIYVLAMRHRQAGSINTSSSYISTYRPMPQSSHPFSLAFPFDTFQLARGAPIPDFDFSSILELHVLVEPALLDPGLPEQLGFHMILTQIRVDHIVPEPRTVSLCALSMMLCFARYRRFEVHGSSIDRCAANVPGHSLSFADLKKERLS